MKFVFHLHFEGFKIFRIRSDLIVIHIHLVIVDALRGGRAWPIGQARKGQSRQEGSARCSAGQEILFHERLTKWELAQMTQASNLLNRINISSWAQEHSARQGVPASQQASGSPAQRAQHYWQPAVHGPVLALP
jgi:hypothetical protein